MRQHLDEQPKRDRLLWGRATNFVACRLAGAVLGAGLAISPSIASDQNEGPTSAQQFYNQGTQKLREGKLREAEASLQMAVASQNEKVQVPALYNLGHARFREGVEELKGGPAAKPSEALANRACANGQEALEAADVALAGWDLEAIVEAYMQGRGARKELKSATEAVKKATETYGAVLSKWQRASGDFKSAHELRTSDSDAQANADVVDQSIARLVDSMKLMMKSSECTSKTRQNLKQKMAELKKRMPKEMRQQCEKGEEEDEEDSDKPPKEPKPGEQEPKQKEGRERLLSPEEAARLLDMLRLDTNRKLPLGMNDTAAAKERKRRDW
jgi:hypothetical protein